MQQAKRPRSARLAVANRRARNSEPSARSAGTCSRSARSPAAMSSDPDRPARNPPWRRRPLVRPDGRRALPELNRPDEPGAVPRMFREPRQMTASSGIRLHMIKIIDPAITTGQRPSGLVSEGAPSRIRTSAHGSGVRIRARLLPAETRFLKRFGARMGRGPVPS